MRLEAAERVVPLRRHLVQPGPSLGEPFRAKRVERLAPRGAAGEGTRLTVTESGFDAIPAERRDEALRMNEGGWEAQVGNVKAHAER